MAETAFYTTLKNRGSIRVSGPDARTFLQGLISNDVSLLASQPLVYACLLNPQGKFLHDFFMSEKDDVITLECEGGERAKDLFARLSKYKLRASVTLTLSEKIKVYVGVGDVTPRDPRHPDLGFRTTERPPLPEQPFEIWDKHRIALTIPDGSRDMVIEKTALDEANIDKLGGVSYDKGCYVGQELTARMHHRGLGKKHLYTVKGTMLRDPGEEIIVNGKLAGEMRSRSGDIGIALLKDEFAA
jgi:folate-binding protein YgfZ